MGGFGRLVFTKPVLGFGPPHFQDHSLLIDFFMSECVPACVSLDGRGEVLISGDILS